MFNIRFSLFLSICCLLSFEGFTQVTLVRTFSSPVLHTTLPDYGEIYGHGNIDNKTIEIFDANFQLIKEVSVANLIEPHITYLSLESVTQYTFNNDSRLEFQIGTSFDENGSLWSNWLDEDLNDLGFRGEIIEISGEKRIFKSGVFYDLPNLNPVLNFDSLPVPPNSNFLRLTFDNATKFIIGNADSLKIWVYDDEFRLIQETPFNICTDCSLRNGFMKNVSKKIMDTDEDLEFLIQYDSASTAFSYHTILDDKGEIIKSISEKVELEVLSPSETGFSKPKLWEKTKHGIGTPDTTRIYSLPDFNLEFEGRIRAGKVGTLTEGRFLRYIIGGIEILDENYQLERTIMGTSSLSEFLDLPGSNYEGWEFLAVNYNQGIHTGDRTYYSSLKAQTGDTLFTFPNEYKCSLSKPSIGQPKILCSYYEPLRYRETKVYRLPFGTQTTSTYEYNPTEKKINVYPNPSRNSDVRVDVRSLTASNFSVSLFSLEGVLFWKKEYEKGETEIVIPSTIFKHRGAFVLSILSQEGQYSKVLIRN